MIRSSVAAAVACACALATGHATANGASIAAALKAPGDTPTPLPLTLDLTAKEPTRWTVVVHNAGPAAVKIPTDQRLVALELAPPAKGKARARTVVCELPADMQPDLDEVGTLSIEPGKTIAIDFDPRLLCFSKADAEALVAADSVVARYSLIGIAPPTPAKGKSASKTALLKSAAVTGIPADARPVLHPVSADSDGSAPPSDSKPDVAVTLAPRLDGAAAKTLNVTVTIENLSERSRTAFVRPNGIGFVIDGPTGAFTCPVKGVPPIAELQRTLAPRGKATVDVLLGATCATQSFDRPGIYVVRPVFASKKPDWDSGRAITGEHVGQPSLLRLRTGRKPLVTFPPRPE